MRAMRSPYEPAEGLACTDGEGLGVPVAVGVALDGGVEGGVIVGVPVGGVAVLVGVGVPKG
jgi:hypothetical protein